MKKSLILSGQVSHCRAEFQAEIRTETHTHNADNEGAARFQMMAQ